MSDYIPSSLIDSESDGPHSPALSSSFGSMNDTSLPTDKMEQLIRKLRSENKALQLRVLGVNELARLLQDRREKVKVLEDKNKRLEVAVVRLENRCANLEQKLRADGSGATVGPKSMQPPSIPGPSRQILEALMKENSELKKALNNMQKKGQSGYLEAVKTTQLEDVIEQQKQELDFLRGQVNTLTTTPLPPASAHLAEEEKSQSGDSALGSNQSALGGGGSPGSLRRQLIKMQHSLKVKDRFCSLLSDQVASLQDQLSQMRLDKTPEPEEPSSSTENSYRPNYAQETGPQDGLYKSEGRPIDQHPQLLELKSQLIKEKEELKGRYDQVFEEQKETLQKERQEHMSVLEKLQKAEQELKRLTKEIDALDKRCEDLQFHNLTLLDDKKQLQETLDQLRGAEGNDAAGGGLEREIRELQDSLHQKVMEHSEELRNKDKEMQKLNMMLEDTQYKYVIAHSKLSEIEKEHEQHLTDLKDKLEYKEIDASSKQNEIEELRQKVRQMQMDMSGLRTKPSQVQVAFPREIPQSVPPLMLPPNMQYVEAVKDGGPYTDPTVSRPPHSRCETTPKLETVNRGMELIARNFEDEPPTTSQSPQPPQPHPGTQHPNSLSFRSQKPPPRHPSPSPSSASSSATPHQMPPHPVPGRRSPLSPHFTQAQPPPRSVHPSHYPTPPPAATPSYLSTPMGYPAMQPRHALPPQQQPHFDPNYPSQQGQYYNQGTRGAAPQPSSSIPPSVRGSRPPKDGEPHDMPPHGFHGDPSHHHQHHTPRRN